MNPFSQLLWKNLSRLRQKAPLVHNITNYVVMNNTANALLALGASPVMAHAPEEVEDMVSLADALVINIGTLSAPWVEAMKKAARKARNLGIPRILDPVGAGATPYRSRCVEELLEEIPFTAIRGNASEIRALALKKGGTKGVDSMDPSESAREAGLALAERYDAVVCISGARDYIITPEREGWVNNGHPLMTKVTGMGCTATALCGAFLGLGEDPFEEMLCGMGITGIAGELAAEESRGPGSLGTAFTDRLHALDEKTLARCGKGAIRS